MRWNIGINRCGSRSLYRNRSSGSRSRYSSRGQLHKPLYIRKQDSNLSILVSRGTHPMKLKETLLQGRQKRHRVSNGRERRSEKEREIEW